MAQNFGSKPNNNCNAMTDVVIIMGFLYLMINGFILVKVGFGSYCEDL
jgi:hypothetical protein